MYISGKENVIADLLSRLPDEEMVRPSEEDYNEIIIASIEKTSKNVINKFDLCKFDSQDDDQKVSNNKIQIITELPNSDNDSQYNIFKNEQEKDKDIEWIKAIMRTNGHNKPKMENFKNQKRRIFYK